MQAPGTHTLTSWFKKNFQKLEISVRVLYLIVLAEMVRFLFLHGPGKKRVCSHSFIYLFNEHFLWNARPVFAKIFYWGQYTIQRWLLFTTFFSLYYRCLSPGITWLFGLPCWGLESAAFTYEKAWKWVCESIFIYKRGEQSSFRMNKINWYQFGE